MDPVTIISIVAALLALTNELLAYSPDGYPKSLFQLVVFIIVKIKRKITEKKVVPNKEPSFLDNKIKF